MVQKNLTSPFRRIYHISQFGGQTGPHIPFRHYIVENGYIELFFPE